MKSFLVVFIILICISAAVAQNCNVHPNVRTYFQNYNHNTYVPPVYNHDYQYIVVPKIIEVEVHRDHYYSIDPYLQQNLLVDAIVGRLSKQVQKSGPVQNNSIQSGPGPVQNNPIPVQNETGSLDLKYRSKGPSPYQNEKLAAIMAKSCNRCHDLSSKWPLITSDNKLIDVTNPYAWKMFGLVSTGEMPKASQGLDEESVKQFYECAKNAGK